MLDFVAFDILIKCSKVDEPGGISIGQLVNQEDKLIGHTIDILLIFFLGVENGEDIIQVLDDVYLLYIMFEYILVHIGYHSLYEYLRRHVLVVPGRDGWLGRRSTSLLQVAQG